MLNLVDDDESANDLRVNFRTFATTIFPWGGLEGGKTARRRLIFANIAANLWFDLNLSERVPKLVPAGDSVVALSSRLLPRFRVFFPASRDFSHRCYVMVVVTDEDAGSCSNDKSSLDPREKQRRRWTPTLSTNWAIFFPSLRLSYRAKRVVCLLAANLCGFRFCYLQLFHFYVLKH